jgi:hypothetical protein
LALPDISGLRILEYLLGHPAFEKTLRIVLSNVIHLKTIERVYSLGAQCFLDKPIQAGDLLKLIEKFPGYWSFSVRREDPFRVRHDILPQR